MLADFKADRNRVSLGRTLGLRQKATRHFCKTSTRRQTCLTPLQNQTLTRDLDATTAIHANLSIFRERDPLLTTYLASNPIFYSLPRTEVSRLISKLRYFEIGPNEVIYEQGFPPTNFYVLRDGQAVMNSNGIDVRVLKAGSSFGGSALFHSNPQDHTVTTLEHCSLFSLEQGDFHEFLQAAQVLSYEALRHFNSTVKQLEGLSTHDIDALSKFSAVERYQPGEHVVVEGESGCVLYFILSGNAVVTANNKEIRRLHSGDCFGEQALLYDGVRTATVSAVSELVVEAIPNQLLYRLFGSSLDDFLYTSAARTAIGACTALQTLESAEKERLIESVRIFTFRQDEIVVAEGTELRAAMYIVLNGKLCTKKGMPQPNSIASVYDCLCAEEVMRDTSGIVFEADIVSESDEVAVGVICKEEYNSCLGTAAALVSTTQFKGISILEELPREAKRRMVKYLRVMEYSDGACIYRQGEAGDTFYILKSGIVTIHQNNTSVRSIAHGNYFGEKAVLAGPIRTETVFAQGKCVVWGLSACHFQEFIDRGTQEMMLTCIKKTDVMLGDLTPVYALGCGLHAYFVKVEDPQGKRYALKAISKTKVTSSYAKHLIAERNICTQIDHKFIVKLVKTFKDDAYLYFLLEYISGSALFDALITVGRFPLPAATFYFGIIVVVLEFLHERDIVYRNLSAENIIITQSGYLKFVGLGIVKFVVDRTYTMSGSPWYIAPEVIMKKGHNSSADIWSAGVLLYQLVCGQVPFGEEETDPYVVLNQVLKSEVRYPEFFDEVPECKALLVQLLQKDPTDRISLYGIKQSELFRNFDWNALLSESLTPPYLPDVSQELSHSRTSTDLRHILAKFEQEEDHEEDYFFPHRVQTPAANWDDEF